jgi:hypothetical protein
MRTRKMLKNPVLAVALSASLAISAQSAQADVLATSTLQLNNLLFSNATTGVTLDSSNFALLTYTNTGDVSSAFSGFASAGTSGVGTPLDLPLICSGPSCPAPGLTPNGFEPLASPPAGSFAAADQNELGFPISGLGTPVGADVESGSWGQIQTLVNGVATSTANNGLSGSFVFALNNSTAVDIDFLATYYHEVAITSDENFPTAAQSRARTNFNIINLSAAGALVFDWSPTDLNWNSSLNAPLPIDVSIPVGAIGQAFNNETPILTAGTLYQLTMTAETLADVQRIPEPGTLALLGLALLGFGFARRKLTATS